MSADSDRPVSEKKPYTPPPPPPGKEVLVSVRGVDKIFTKGGETVYALNDINIDVYQAEYLSIMGPSGSGKSTLFNMIGALDKPSRGEISVGGVSLPKLASRELSYFRCKHIGYVFQSYNLIPWLTAMGNVMLPLTFLGTPEEEARARAKHVLELVGLGHRLVRVEHPPDEFSLPAPDTFLLVLSSCISAFVMSTNFLDVDLTFLYSITSSNLPLPM